MVDQRARVVTLTQSLCVLARPLSRPACELEPLQGWGWVRSPGPAAVPSLLSCLQAALPPPLPSPRGNGEPAGGQPPGRLAPGERSCPRDLGSLPPRRSFLGARFTWDPESQVLSRTGPHRGFPCPSALFPRAFRRLRDTHQERRY